MDNTQQKQYTVVVFTEDKVGLLNRITIVFTRRHINIDSLTTSESEVKGIFRYTIVVRTTEKVMNNVVAQIEKLTEVLKAFACTEDEVIHQEIALYKIATDKIVSQDVIGKVIRLSNARIIELEKDYIVIEKIGYKHETQELFEQLEPYGILQFARSGSVAITKARKELSGYLHELEMAAKQSNEIRNWKLNN